MVHGSLVFLPFALLVCTTTCLIKHSLRGAAKDPDRTWIYHWRDPYVRNFWGINAMVLIPMALYGMDSIPRWVTGSALLRWMALPIGVVSSLFLTALSIAVGDRLFRRQEDQIEKKANKAQMATPRKPPDQF